MEMNKVKEAESEFKRAIEINKDFVEAHYNLGVLFTETKRNEEAVSEFIKTIEIKEDYVMAHLFLGSLYLESNRKNEGKEELDIAYKLAIQNGRSDLISLIENYQKKINKQK